MLTTECARIEIALVADTTETRAPVELPNDARRGEPPVHVRIGRRTLRAVAWYSDSAGDVWECILGYHNGQARLVCFPDSEVDEVLVG